MHEPMDLPKEQRGAAIAILACFAGMLVTAFLLVSGLNKLADLTKPSPAPMHVEILP